MSWSYRRSYLQMTKTVEGDELIEVTEKKLHDRAQLWWEKFTDLSVVYVHIPKTGGTSIETFVYNTKVPSSQHFTALELRSQRPQIFGSIPSFTIVRDPYDRFLSSYFYLLNGGNQNEIDRYWQGQIIECADILDFVRKYLPVEDIESSEIVPVKWYDLPSHFVPQYMFIYDSEDTLLVDKVITINEMRIHGLKSLDISGLMDDTIPVIRSTTRPINIGYDIDGILAKHVLAVYRKDFELLKFDENAWKLLLPVLIDDKL